MTKPKHDRAVLTIDGVRYLLIAEDPPVPEPVAEPRQPGLYAATLEDGTVEFWLRTTWPDYPWARLTREGTAYPLRALNLMPKAIAIRGPITPEDALRGVEARK